MLSEIAETAAALIKAKAREKSIEICLQKGEDAKASFSAPTEGRLPENIGEVATCTKAECLSRKSPDSLIQYEH